MNEKNRWFSRAFGRQSISAKPEKTKMAGLEHQGGFIALHNSLSPGWTTASYAALANEGFMKNPIVHRCVRVICETAGALPWVVFADDSEVVGSDVLQLIERPNAQQSRRTFIETICGHLLLSGNAYIEACSLDDAGLPAQIYTQRPDCVTPQYDEKGWATGFKISTGGAQRTISVAEDVGVSAMLHLKLFHPLDDQIGFAPLQAALMALDTHNAAACWNKALLDNAARPSGALVYAPGDGSNLTPEQFDALRSQLETTYAGAKNAGKPMILEGGLDWKAMGLSPKDMDFVETKNGASRDIALAFGVPPMLLGIPGDNTYSNYQEANRALYRLTVLPMMARIAEAFSAWLEPAVGRRLRFELDMDQIDSLNHDRAALWSRLENASFISDDEKRIAVGYAPLSAEDDR